jgi:hypothetical protein
MQVIPKLALREAVVAHSQRAMQIASALCFDRFPFRDELKPGGSANDLLLENGIHAVGALRRLVVPKLEPFAIEPGSGKLCRGWVFALLLQADSIDIEILYQI